ncbi:MAG: hypothetical protein CMG05_02215 [Candidatus Marinimicrobia bacterium]|nr:hypothetical protein [Candidatus Neomarinimicrobiota bacterium]|tara:strand:+ start:108 stop:491 length:384 start_codon:yes stop_codon:yes gene_type:complete
MSYDFDEIERIKNSNTKIDNKSNDKKSKKSLFWIFVALSIFFILMPDNSSSNTKKQTSYKYEMNKNFTCSWCSKSFNGWGYSTIMGYATYLGDEAKNKSRQVQDDFELINSYCSRKCATEWLNRDRY